MGGLSSRASLRYILWMPQRLSPKFVIVPRTHGNCGHLAGLVRALPKGRVLCLSYPKGVRWDLEGYRTWLQAQVRGLGEFILIAESFGSLPALALAAGRVSGLKGVVLLGGFVRNPHGWARTWMLNAPVPGFLLKAMAVALLLGPRATRSDRASLLASLDHADMDDMRSRLRVALGSDLRSNLKGIKAPVIAFFGRRDRVVPLASQQGSLPRSFVVKALDAHHALGMTHPLDVLLAVRSLGKHAKVAGR